MTRTRIAVDILAGVFRVCWWLLMSFACATVIGIAGHFVYYGLSFGWNMI